MLNTKKVGNDSSNVNNSESNIDDVVASISNNCIETDKFIIVRVIEISDVTIAVTHVDNVMIYSSVHSIKCDVIGYVVSINKYDISVALLVDVNTIALGKELYISTTPISIKVNTKVRQAVLDPLGNVLVSANKNYVKPPEDEHDLIEIFQEPLSFNERVELNEQIITGSNIVDTMYNIVYGCRILIVGNKMVYKTNFIQRVMMNMCSNAALLDHAERDVFIYVSVGQRAKEVVSILDELSKNNVSNIIIISATASTTIGMKVLAPYAAMSVAVKIAEDNKNVVVFIDDLTSHAIAIRELYSILKYNPGRESYPSNIFNLHASLLERAGKFRNKGSVTCIPVIQVIEDDVTGYITTNAISITDGQIYLRESMFKDKIIPPVDSGLSVSRIGSNYQYLIYRKISQFCRRALSDYYDSLNFYKMYKSDCEENIISKIRTGLLVKLALYNSFTNVTSLAYQISCLLLVSLLRNDNTILMLGKDITDDEYISIISEYIDTIYHYIRKNTKLLVSAIKSNSPGLIEELEKVSRDAINQVIK